MNSRIYTKDLLDKAINDYLKKNYCPFCYNFLIGSVIQTATYVSSRSNSDDTWCKDCKLKLQRSNLLTKEEVRNKKIDEVLKK
jgi:RNase P subunit RPR2